LTPHTHMHIVCSLSSFSSSPFWAGRFSFYPRRMQDSCFPLFPPPAFMLKNERFFFFFRAVSNDLLFILGEGKMIDHDCGFFLSLFFAGDCPILFYFSPPPIYSDISPFQSLPLRSMSRLVALQDVIKTPFLPLLRASWDALHPFFPSYAVP